MVVRAHPNNEKYSLDVLILELKEEGEIYLIAPSLREALLGEACAHIKRLRLAVNRQGDVFVWPFRLPGPDGKIDAWNASALEAAERAERKWVRITANRRVGAYDVAEANITEEPRWPDMPFNELLRIAFKGKVIDTLDRTTTTGRGLIASKPAPC